MSKVYFASDPHFGHERLCQGLRQMSAEESDELIIKNWNNIVTKHDTVYLLGDLTMESVNHIYKLARLNGKIKIIGGNHDTEKVCKELQKLQIPILGCINYKGFLCTHVPIHPSELRLFKGNIHGHIHKSGKIEINGELVKYEPDILGNKYLNVNLEFHNYTPIEFNDLLKLYERN